MEKENIKMREKNITMEDIVKGLGIEVADIVRVDNYVLVCKENYDLVRLADGRYCSEIPNLILGMVSGKRAYSVFKVSSLCEYGATCK